MSWTAYQQWQAHDRQNRPDVSLADGYLAGAAVSLQIRPDDAWTAEILGQANPSEASDGSTRDDLSGPRLELLDRLAETRLLLAAGNGYVPTLEVAEDGEFDLSGWASGFLEAVGADLEVWALVLANTREGGLLGLLGSHAVGPMGGAARTRISTDPESSALESIRSVSWEFIPALMSFLYHRKLELAAVGD